MTGSHSTVESPHPATLPSVQLLPFLDELLLWQLTPDAPGWERTNRGIMPHFMLNDLYLLEGCFSPRTH